MRNRTIKKSFYLNEEENRLLKEKCFGGFISESDFFRMCILNKEIKEKPDEKFYDTLEQLRGVATNINQIARVANQTRVTDEMKYVSGVNCLPETAYEEMIATKNRFNKGIVSDCICQYYGLSVLEDKIWKHKGAYKRFAKENPYMQMVKSDVDRCLEASLYEKEFSKRLEKLGYSYSNTYEQGLIIIDNSKGRKIYLQKFFGDSYSHNKVIDRILDYENKNIAQYGRKYKMPKEEYIKMLEMKRKNEIKKLPLLYILFCLLLKIDPLPAKMDFGKARVSLTKEMRIELKYMNEISRQAVLLTENKIGSLDDLNAFRTKLEDEVRTLKGTRESLQRKKRKSTNQECIAKFDIELRLIAPKIKQLNTDIQNCYKIEKRTILWQQEYDKAMEKEQEQQKQNELKQSKKKLFEINN